MDNAQLEMLPNLAAGLFIRCKNTGVAALRPTEDGFESITSRRFLGELQNLFVQVLELAQEMKLLKVGRVCLDGTKIHASELRPTGS